MKLPLKILLFLLPLIVIPLLLLGKIAYDELSYATEQSKFEEMQAEVERVAAQIETKVSTAVANIELFSNNNTLIKHVLNTNEEQAQAKHYGSLMRVFQSFQEA